MKTDKNAAYQFVEHMEQADGLYKDELLEKIISICSQDKYKLITDFEWYVCRSLLFLFR